jgi:hypothetical protein
MEETVLLKWIRYNNKIEYVQKKFTKKTNRININDAKRSHD